MAELTSGKTEYIHIIGGEPMLHPQLSEIHEIARKYFPLPAIRLYTNGTLVLGQGEKFWQNMKQNRIILYCSHYPGVDYEKIKGRADGYGVLFDFTSAVPSENTRLMNDKYVLDLSGGQDYKRSFIYCPQANNCVTVKNGNFYTCPTTATAVHFIKYFNCQIDLTEQDYIDIHKAKDIGEILSFAAKPIPFCRYCNIPARQTAAIPFQQSKRQIDEWV
jgi:hypothetical protein